MKSRILFLVVVGVLATACGEAVGGPELSGACVEALRIGSVTYSLSSEPLPTGAPAPTNIVAEVARLVDCQDTLEPGEHGEQIRPFEDGDSNTLPAGTKLYEVEGFSTSVRLAARPGSVWLVFVAGGG